MQFNLVAASNEGAVRLWEKMGFKLVGTLPGAFRHPSIGFVDAHVVYKLLTSAALPSKAERVGARDPMTGSVPTLSQWLAEAPFGVAMSSGFFAFYAHCGVMAAFEEQGLAPTEICGSSAGALIGGAWAAGVDAHSLRDVLFSLRRADFWDPRPGLGFLAGARFVKRLEELLPVERFEQCRARLAVSAFDVRRQRTVVLSEGALAPAIAASCAVPLLFHPVRIRGRSYLDGGIRDRHGMAGTRAERVFYHHISSRSPWRNPRSSALKVPRRPGLKALIIAGLPRVGPFKLERGRDAYWRALYATRAALTLPATAVIQTRST